MVYRDFGFVLRAQGQGFAVSSLGVLGLRLLVSGPGEGINVGGWLR